MDGAKQKAPIRHQLFVGLPSGRTKVIDVTRSNTVRDLKRELCDTYGAKMGALTVVYMRVALREKTLLWH